MRCRRHNPKELASLTPKKPKRGWCVKHGENDIIIGTCGKTRQEAIRSFLEVNEFCESFIPGKKLTTWAEYRKQGFSVVTVEVTEVEYGGKLEKA